MIFSEKNLQSSLSASNTRWRSNPRFWLLFFMFKINDNNNNNNNNNNNTGLSIIIYSYRES